MTCQKCGEPCKGQLCSLCADMEHQEDYYGTPAAGNFDWSEFEDGENDE